MRDKKNDKDPKNAWDAQIQDAEKRRKSRADEQADLGEDDFDQEQQFAQKDDVEQDQYQSDDVNNEEFQSAADEDDEPESGYYGPEGNRNR